jgi:hypothetical protein
MSEVENQEIPKEKNIVEEAREERILMEKAREELRKENDRTEMLEAQRALSGKSKGAVNPPKTEFEEYEERTKEKYRGTGLNPALGYKREM